MRKSNLAFISARSPATAASSRPRGLRTPRVGGQVGYSKIEMCFFQVASRSEADIYRVFFFTGPPLKTTKSKIMLECPDWASPGPPKIVKVYGLGLP